jgi:phosphohistidine phosphatase
VNLLLWRHPEVDDADTDASRRLTPKGLAHAERMSRWLRVHLPSRFEVLASPARWTRQTADALGVDYRVDRRMLPGADVADYLAAMEWPEGPRDARGTIVVVGHQPVLGRLASLLLSGAEADWGVKKGAVWWMSTRDRDGDRQLMLRTAVAPDLL